MTKRSTDGSRGRARRQAPEPGSSVGVLVLGMHRSGTSFITNILAELGCDLGGEVIDPEPANPRGFWEHQDILLIHEEFLRQQRRTWSDPRPFWDRDFSGAEADVARRKIAEALGRDMLDKPLWVLKDPRMCRLSGLWRGVFEDVTFTPRFVHTLRSPLAVAGSLLERDGIPIQKSLLLWLRHSLEAELFSRGSDRAWIQLDDFKAAPAREVRRLVESLGLADSLDLGRLDQVVTRVFEPKLLRRGATIQEAGKFTDVHPWVARTYELLLALGSGEEQIARTQLDEIRDQLQRADMLLQGDTAAWENEVHAERYTRLLKETERLSELITVQRKEIAAGREEFALQQRESAAGREETALQREEIVAGRAATEFLREEFAAGREETALQREDLAAGREETTLLRKEFATEREESACQRSELAAFRDVLVQKHVELLNRSLELSSRIEDRWVELRDELDALSSDKARVEAALSEVESERDLARRERDEMGEDRDRVAEERSLVAEERDRVAEERSLVAEERDRVAEERDRLTGEIELVTAHCDELAKAHEALSEEMARAREQMAGMAQEIDGLASRVNEEIHERNRTYEEMLGITRTKSWRWTAPLRGVRGAWLKITR